jgi:beta-phosphoglucomutase
MTEFKPKAFLFDLNGTMIDDMAFHLDVWHSILNDDYNAGLSREEVRAQMYGKNQELLERVFGKDRFTIQEAERISRLKEDRYQQLYRPHLALLPGLGSFLKVAAHHNLRMAIGSAAIPYNIDFVLDTLGIRHYFSAVVSAEDVRESKPNPETYLAAASRIGVEPKDCLVFEDAPKGVEAAERAGMKAVVLTTLHSDVEFSWLSNILMFISDYRDPRLTGLFPPVDRQRSSPKKQ